jgi:hypothetical protein
MDRYPDEDGVLPDIRWSEPENQQVFAVFSFFRGWNTRNEVSRSEIPKGFHMALMDTKPVIGATSFDDDQVVPAKTVRNYGRFSQLAYIEVDVRVCLICHQSSLFADWVSAFG